MTGIARRDILRTGAAGALLGAGPAWPAAAQVTTRLSIATGGTGGVYYPLGGGMAPP